MEIAFWFACCVNEAQFGVWKMFVDEPLQFLLDVARKLPRYGSSVKVKWLQNRV